MAIFTVLFLIVVAILVFDTDMVPVLAVTALADWDTLGSDTLSAILSCSANIRPFFVRLVRFADVEADCVFETASLGRTDDNTNIVAALLLPGSIFLSDSDMVVLNKQLSVSLNYLIRSTYLNVSILCQKSYLIYDPDENFLSFFLEDTLFRCTSPEMFNLCVKFEVKAKHTQYIH